MDIYLSVNIHRYSPPLRRIIVNYPFEGEEAYIAESSTFYAAFGPAIEALQHQGNHNVPFSLPHNFKGYILPTLK